MRMRHPEVHCSHWGGRRFATKNSSENAGKDLLDITRLLSAHKGCFVGHQVYTVLNTGRCAMQSRG